MINKTLLYHISHFYFKFLSWFKAKRFKNCWSQLTQILCGSVQEETCRILYSAVICYTHKIFCCFNFELIDDYVCLYQQCLEYWWNFSYLCHSRRFASLIVVSPLSIHSDPNIIFSNRLIYLREISTLKSNNGYLRICRSREIHLNANFLKFKPDYLSYWLVTRLKTM